MALRNITSANATGVLVVNTVFPAGIVLQEFGTDQAISQDDETIGNATMGVDGKLSVSYKPSPKTVTLTLIAASTAHESLETVKMLTEANQTPYECTLVFTIPSVSRTYTYTGGIIITAPGMPGVKGELDQVSYKFMFEKMTPTMI